EVLLAATALSSTTAAPVGPDLWTVAVAIDAPLPITLEAAAPATVLTDFKPDFTLPDTRSSTLEAVIEDWDAPRSVSEACQLTAARIDRAARKLGLHTGPLTVIRSSLIPTMVSTVEPERWPDMIDRLI